MDIYTELPILRTHSYFSFLESLLSPESLVRIALEQGVSILGLTDHSFMSGTVEFYEACIKFKIKPIIGLEIDTTYQGFTGPLTFFAKDGEGWSNLSRLSSLCLIQGDSMSLNQIEAYRNGLLCISGGNHGVLRKLILNSLPEQKTPHHYLNQLKRIFHNDLYIELQRFDTGPLKNEQALIQLAKEKFIPLIATQNIFYQEKADQAKYQTLTAIRKNKTIQNLTENDLPPGNAYFPSPDAFCHRFRDIPEALVNLRGLDSECQVDIPIGKTHFPAVAIPQGETQSDFIRKKAYKGAKKKYKTLTPEIVDRLEYELGIIAEMGYEPIFLIVEDVLNHARKLDIPTSSRGSAASSLVAYCLNITSPDPLALNLYFERFLNPARKKPPDIDTDIASHRRDEVIEYVFETYGKDKVAMVGTINRYRPKSAFVDVAKAYGLSSETIQSLSKRLPSSYRFQRDDDTEKNPFSSLLKVSTIPIIKDIIADTTAILDNPRHLSVHPGGVVITPFPTIDLVPLTHSSTLGLLHTQFDLAGIEKFGLVKIDLLGIRGLTVLGEVATRIHSWQAKEFKNGLSVLESIPEDDQKTAKTVSEARTIGCFQIESPGMRATLQEIHANKVEDVMAALALYRPGPLRGGLRDAFVRRFRGDEPVNHLHKSLERLLEDTLGVILYQEQVLQIAHELGGLTIAQADILRRAMSHFDPGGVMVSLRRNFIEGAFQRKKVPIETAERIWEMMVAFAGYGFPKAHAASYAKLAWNSAWCKTHFPAEFMAAVLGFGGGYYSQRVYLMEAQRLGLQVHPPHINHANHRFRVKYPDGEPKLYMGLNQVRDLTQRTINSILQNRPFHSLEEFLMKVNPQKNEALNLLKCGAFEGLTSIPDGLIHLDQPRSPGQLLLFKSSSQKEDWTIEEKNTAQREILGVSLELSPLDQYADEIKAHHAVSTLKAKSMLGKKIWVAGMRQSMRRVQTQKKQTMCFLSLEDFEGSLPILIPPLIYKRSFQALKRAGPFLVEGVINQDSERERVFMIAVLIILLTDS